MPFASGDLAGVVLLAAVALAVLVLVALAVVAARGSRRGRPVRPAELEGVDLGAVLGPLEAQLSVLERRVAGIEGRTEALEAASRVAVSRVGLVRFNPFEDTGGNQSFALALLDAAGDGIVVSSLHARSGTRIYAKAIRAGRAATALSEEEADAVRQALGERSG